MGIFSSWKNRSNPLLKCLCSSLLFPVHCRLWCSKIFRSPPPLMVDCSPTRRYDEDIFRDETILPFVPMYWGISDWVEKYAPCVSCKWIKDEVKHFKYKAKMNSCCFCLLVSLLGFGEKSPWCTGIKNEALYYIVHLFSRLVRRWARTASSSSTWRNSRSSFAKSWREKPSKMTTQPVWHKHKCKLEPKSNLCYKGSGPLCHVTRRWSCGLIYPP